MCSISKFLTYFIGNELFLSYRGKLYKWVEGNKKSDITQLFLSVKHSSKIPESQCS